MDPDPELEQLQILIKMSLAIGRQTKWQWFHVFILTISADGDKRVKTRKNYPESGSVFGSQSKFIMIVPSLGANISEILVNILYVEMDTDLDPKSWSKSGSPQGILIQVTFKI